MMPREIASDVASAREAALRRSNTMARWAFTPWREKREVPCEWSGGRLVFVADVAGDPAEAEFHYEVVGG